MDATMENKMGLPPPYEQLPSMPAPPPTYHNEPPASAPPRTQVVTTTSPGDTGSIRLGPGPTGITCPKCNRSMVTRVDYVPNDRTHIISAALCIISSCCCGCFVPYCMKSCKTANHYCSKCRAYIGTFVPS